MSEQIFLLVLGIWLVFAFNWITMFQIQWPEYLYSYIQVIIGIAVIFRYMILKPKNIDSIILILIILAAFLISRDRSAIGSVLET